MISVLQKARSEMVETRPFPHIVIQNALNEELYLRLAQEFPAFDLLIDGRPQVSNDYLHFSASKALGDPRISPLWRAFMAYHTSNLFFREVVAVFGAHMRKLNPGLEKTRGKELEAWQTSVRFNEQFRDAALECQFTYCAPVARQSRSIGPHVDREVALYAALLYFRMEGDDSSGGDLELYEFRGHERQYDCDRQAPDELVRTIKRIEYRKNTFVMFLHSPESLHGVTPRSVTPFPRLHINFVGELQEKVFDLSPYREQRVQSRIAHG